MNHSKLIALLWEFTQSWILPTLAIILIMWAGALPSGHEWRNVIVGGLLVWAALWILSKSTFKTNYNQ